MSYNEDYVPSNSPELCHPSSFVDPFVATFTREEGGGGGGGGGGMDQSNMDSSGMGGGAGPQGGGGGGMQEFPPMGDDYGGPPGPNQSVLPFNPQHQQQHQGGDQHNPRAQAYMWQQNHYMESGFHSGSTTQPPSMTGQEDEQDGSYCGTGANSMTGSSLYDLDSQNQSAVSSVHSSSGFVAEPETYIPQLITTLTDEDQFVVDQCLLKVDKFSKVDKFLNALFISEPLVNAIINAVNKAAQMLRELTASPTPPDEEQMKAAVERAICSTNIMRNISNKSQGREVIVLAGGVPGITSFISCPIDRVMINAITVIHNLLLKNNSEDLRNNIRAAGGTEGMLILLKRDKDKLLTIVADCLRILALNHAPTKEIILMEGGPSRLVQIMLENEYKNLQKYVTRLLKVLSACPRSKAAIIDAGGMHAMAKLLSGSQIHNDTKSYCILALRNCSDAAAKQELDLGQLLEALVQILGGDDPQFRVYAAEIINNLTFKNEANKLSVCKAQGIPVIFHAIKNGAKDPKLLEPALCALRHVTNHRAGEEAQDELLSLNPMGLLLTVLHSYMSEQRKHWPSIKAITELIRHLSQRPMNQRILRDSTWVASIRDLTMFLVDGLMTGKIAASKVENVHPQAVVESCLTCLFLMSKDPANRAIIMEKANVIPTLTDLLPQDRELLQRVAIGALFHLSFEPAFGARLQSETLLGRSMEEHARKLTKIDNEEIAFYASHVMSNLACLREGKIPLPPSNMPQPPQPHHSHQMPPQQQHPHSQQHQAMQQQQHQGMAPQHMQQQGGPGQMMPQDMYRSQVPPQQMQQQQQMMQQQQSLAGGRMPQPGYDPNMMDPSMSGPGGPQGGPPQHHQQPQQFGASNLDDLQSLMDMEGMGDW